MQYNAAAPSNEISHINSLLPGTVRVNSLLADGGQGTVYKGSVGSRPAAVKFYAFGQTESRIDREVEALGLLHCDSIAPLLWSGDVAYSGQRLKVVATAFVPGRPLNEVLKERQLGDSELGILAFDVATAIEHLWRLRIVHRDLKPSNLILEPSGRISVIDLGVARHLSQSSLTGTGMSWGTMGYLSPEQMRGMKQLTCKSDMFALGVIMLEARLGRHPTNRDQAALISTRFHEFLPGNVASSPHAKIIKSLLQPRPTARPAPTSIINNLVGHARKGI